MQEGGCLKKRENLGNERSGLKEADEFEELLERVWKEIKNCIVTE